MKDKINIDNLLDDILNGIISKDDARQLLVQQNVTDADKEIDLHFATAVAVQRHMVLSQVKKVHTQYTEHHVKTNESIESGNKKKTVYIKLVNWGLRIAATILLFSLGWLGWSLNSNSSAKLYAEMYHFYNINTDRSVIDEIVPHKMVEEYKRNNYEAVLTIFESLKITNNREKFLAASAYHETKNYKQAIDVLTQILNANKQNGSRLYNDEAEYYTGLNYLKMDDPEAALRWFEKIYNDPDHTFHDQITRWTLIRLQWLK